MPYRFTTPRKYNSKYPFQILANNHLPPHVLIHNINIVYWGVASACVTLVFTGLVYSACLLLSMICIALNFLPSFLVLCSWPGLPFSLPFAAGGAGLLFSLHLDVDVTVNLRRIISSAALHNLHHSLLAAPDLVFVVIAKLSGDYGRSF